jgi:SAM-dependent methyltransferase
MGRVAPVTKAGWTRENLRHGAAMLRYGRHPAATVYDSIGNDFFLALAPGWLNLGLWEGDGRDPAEAPVAVRRLVETVAAALPKGAALNITHSQLVAGTDRLREAGAHGVNGDATRMPFADRSFDGVISVEAAFHFPSRARFFAEAFRVLQPGGVLTMSDIPTYRYPRGPRELVAAVSQLRVWGLDAHAAATPVEIVRRVEDAGFRDIRTDLVGERVIEPALRFVRDRLRTSREEAAGSYRLAASIMLSQVELLWERGMIDYLLLRATKPSGTQPHDPVARAMADTAGAGRVSTSAGRNAIE